MPQTFLLFGRLTTNWQLKLPFLAIVYANRNGIPLTKLIWPRPRAPEFRPDRGGIRLYTAQDHTGHGTWRSRIRFAVVAACLRCERDEEAQNYRSCDK